MDVGPENAEQEEAARPILLKPPYEASQAEVDEHYATGHVQYRNWCAVCLATKGFGQQHRAAPAEDETAVPTIFSDYAFMGQDDGKCMPILVLKCKRTKRLAASFVPAKGVNPYAIKFFSAFIESTGFRRIMNKSDGEHSIVALKKRAAEAAGVTVEAMPQEIPIDDQKPTER